VEEHRSIIPGSDSVPVLLMTANDLLCALQSSVDRDDSDDDN